MPSLDERKETGGSVCDGRRQWKSKQKLLSYSSFIAAHHLTQGSLLPLLACFIPALPTWCQSTFDDIIGAGYRGRKDYSVTEYLLHLQRDPVSLF